MSSMYKWAHQSLILKLRGNVTFAAWVGTDIGGTVRVYRRPAPARARLTATPASYKLAIIDWNLTPSPAIETDTDLEVLNVPGQILLVAVGPSADEDIEDGYTALSAALKPHGTVTLDNLTYADGETRNVIMGGLIGPMASPDAENARKFQGTIMIEIDAQAA